MVMPIEGSESLVSFMPIAGLKSPAAFTRSYLIKHKLIKFEATMVNTMENHIQTVIDLQSYSDLCRLNLGSIYTTINKDHLSSTPNVGVMYFRLGNGIIYTFHELLTNPMGLVLDLSRINTLKIKNLKIDKINLQFTLTENGLPPLCYLTPEADQYEIELDDPLP